MSNLLMLIVMVIASVGVATLVLVLIEAILIKLPEMLVRDVKGNSAPSVPARQRSTARNKARSCSFCQSGTYRTGSKTSAGKDSRSSSDNSLWHSRWNKWELSLGGEKNVRKKKKSTPSLQSAYMLSYDGLPRQFHCVRSSIASN